jgi:hypothetical protein
VTVWRVEGTCGEVADVLGDPLDLTRWWPAVYLEARELEPGDADGRGRRVGLLTKGWLPYTLRWELERTESRYPHGFTIAVRGDLEGRGIWTFTQDGRWVDVTFDWQVRATRPFLARLSPLLRPLFAANHRWAMAEGLAALELELARRRATTPEARSRVPAPRGPVTYAAASIVVAAAAVGAGLAYLTIRASGRRRRD